MDLLTLVAQYQHLKRKKFSILHLYVMLFICCVQSVCVQTTFL